MKAFRFGLEKVLGLRAWDEKEARMELGRAVGALVELEQRLLENERARRETSAKDFGASGDIAALAALENYRLRLDWEKKQLLQQKAAADAMVEAARETWRAAAAHKKALENVKDRRFAAYKKESLAAQEKEIEDAGNRPAANRPAAVPENEPLT
jgi:flagellar FliJ protein